MKTSEYCLLCAQDWLGLIRAPYSSDVLGVNVVRLREIVDLFHSPTSFPWQWFCDDEQGATIMCFAAAIAESEGD